MPLQSPSIQAALAATSKTCDDTPDGVCSSGTPKFALTLRIAERRCRRPAGPLAAGHSRLLMGAAGQVLSPGGNRYNTQLSFGYYLFGEARSALRAATAFGIGEARFCPPARGPWPDGRADAAAPLRPRHAGARSARWTVAVERQRGRAAPLWVGVVPESEIGKIDCVKSEDRQTTTCDPRRLEAVALPGTVCTGYVCSGAATFAGTDG